MEEVESSPDVFRLALCVQCEVRHPQLLDNEARASWLKFSGSTFLGFNVAACVSLVASSLMWFMLGRDVGLAAAPCEPRMLFAWVEG